MYRKALLSHAGFANCAPFSNLPSILLQGAQSRPRTLRALTLWSTTKRDGVESHSGQRPPCAAAISSYSARVRPCLLRVRSNNDDEGYGRPLSSAARFCSRETLIPMDAAASFHESPSARRSKALDTCSSVNIRLRPRDFCICNAFVLDFANLIARLVLVKTECKPRYGDH